MPWLLLPTLLYESGIAVDDPSEFTNDANDHLDALGLDCIRNSLRQFHHIIGRHRRAGPAGVAGFLRQAKSCT
jgi:hypothetical protein